MEEADEYEDDEAADQGDDDEVDEPLTQPTAHAATGRPANADAKLEISLIGESNNAVLEQLADRSSPAKAKSTPRGSSPATSPRAPKVKPRRNCGINSPLQFPSYQGETLTRLSFLPEASLLPPSARLPPPAASGTISRCDRADQTEVEQNAACCASSSVGTRPPPTVHERLNRAVDELNMLTLQRLELGEAMRSP